MKKEHEYTSRVMTHHVNTCDSTCVNMRTKVMPKSTRWMPGAQGISYTPPHGARRRPYGQACVENGGHEKCANEKKLSGKEKNEDMEKNPTP